METKTTSNTVLQPLQPLQLSPEQVLHNSPRGQGLAYDVYIKPPTCKKVIQVYSPSPKLPTTDKLRIAEERKKDIEQETVNKQKEKTSKIRKIMESQERQLQERKENILKKENSVEENMAAQKKELEQKREANRRRLMEAQKTKEELVKSKKEVAEKKLAQLDIAKEKYEAKKNAIKEKAKEDIIKVDMVRAEQQRKLEELDERVKHRSSEADEKRTAYLSGIKEKCGKHVEDAKKTAELIRISRAG